MDTKQSEPKIENDVISIRGARTHNLKNIDLDIPKGKFIVITGLSGSGKSSLAFDTIFAEGQRRYVESLSTYARQFLEVLEKPDVDLIEGLSPSIAIDQKTRNQNPRSTVGTTTEIHDYLRLLYSRTGEVRCPEHKTPLKAFSVGNMADEIIDSYTDQRIAVLAPIRLAHKKTLGDKIDHLKSRGFFRMRCDGKYVDLDDNLTNLGSNIQKLDIVVDRLKASSSSRQRMCESIETALGQANNQVTFASLENETEVTLSSIFSCSQCDYAIDDVEPRMFSFNNPMGACETCNGLGKLDLFDKEKIILHPELSLAAGAIPGWDRKNSFFYQVLQDLATYYQFELEKPFEELNTRIQEIILHGSGSEKINFNYASRGGATIKKIHSFEGVVPNFQRRYSQTKEQIVKEELKKYISLKQCPSCAGTRLKAEALNIFVGDRNIAHVCDLTLEDCLDFFKHLKPISQYQIVSDRVTREIIKRLSFLVEVGLGYLTLSRSSETLSGGESQRIRLASQIGSGLTGVTYVLDEPSIGLHQRDNRKLLDSLRQLQKLKNTVIVVEHDEETISEADYIIDMGPGAGEQGGEIIAQGSVEDITNSSASITGKFLNGQAAIPPHKQLEVGPLTKFMSLVGARGNNLKNVDIKIPLGLMVAITGVSGSGKSTLINRTLAPAITQDLRGVKQLAEPFDNLEIPDGIKYLVTIDQSPIGKTPRSNPATYTGVFSAIRDLFSSTRLSKERGYTPGRFSFNVTGGRCETCQGDGSIKIELHFLPDVYVTCETCKGSRYNQETLEITYHGKNISEVLDLTVTGAAEFFKSIPSIKKKLDILEEVGLGYIKLGQSAITLSGGEAQRVKLSAELSKRGGGETVYILDEPTTGLHFHDVSWLIKVLVKLRDRGNSIIVIEHNLDLISRSDWIIDMGPEGGLGGGSVVEQGTPSQLLKRGSGHTAQALRTGRSYRPTGQKKTG